MTKAKGNRRRPPRPPKKLSAQQTAEFFAACKARADFKAFDKIMKRRGQPPREGDEIPSR